MHMRFFKEECIFKVSGNQCTFSFYFQMKNHKFEKNYEICPLILYNFKEVFFFLLTVNLGKKFLDCF